MDWLTALLIWLSSDQTTVDMSKARAAAAVECAYASMQREVVEEEKPQAQKPASGGKPVPNCPTGNCPLPRR